MKLVLSIVLLFLFSRIPAQIPKSPGTIDIPQITIIDKKLENFQIDNKLIDSTFVINNLNTSLADIILKNTSLYSRTYGPGLIASYGIRGSNSSETVVLWNDFPLNNIMLASADVSLLAINSYSKIKILKNNFISGGIGGTINIEDGATDNVSGNIGLSYSSLLNFDFNGTGSFLIGRIKNSLSIVFSKSKTEFEYTRGKSQIKTTTSDASKAVINYNAPYIKKNKTFKLFVMANKLFRQIPPSR
ncbi:MAG TPA: Plug domain-containing protein, partial [Bacteroidetes bacterium]|nr:Plug domain-containing protein [Bacteroidota bacterium]